MNVMTFRSPMTWLLYVVFLPTAAVGLFLAKESEEASIKVNSVATKMISKLVEESESSILLFIDLNSDILHSFVKSHNLAITLEVNDLTTNGHFDNRKINAVILHLKNFDEFENFFGLIRTETFSYDGHFIILYDTDDVHEIEKIFATFWKVYIYNVNVLIIHLNSTDSVSMFTQMPFADGSCHNTKPILINQFKEASKTWSTNNFFPKKFRQLNRCPLRFGCYEFTPALIVDTSENGSRIFSGIHVDLLRALSEVLNYTASFVELKQENGIIYKNGTATGMLQKAITNEVDFVFTSLQQERVDALSPTRHVLSDKIIMVVPPPFLIDPMTKMFLPFTVASWAAIGMIVLSACCIIKTLKFAPAIVHDYVIGANVKGSMLNVFNIFIGGAQQVLPRGNFPRFLLTNFLIFALIIRTLYQGEVFKLLKRDVRTVQLNTIDEYVEHKFTFYIYEAYVARLQGTKMMERYQIINNTEAGKYAAMTLDSSFKGVMFEHLGHILYQNVIKRKNFTFRISREVLYTNSYVYYFTKNFYLVGEFNRLIEIFEAAGLIDVIIGKYVNLNYNFNSINTIERSPPSAINYDNVKGFFYLFYCGCVLALVAFLCEIVYEYILSNERVSINLCC